MLARLTEKTKAGSAPERTLPCKRSRFSEKVSTQSVYETLSAPGNALDAPLLREMSNLFQFDFSKVRVHTDDHAATSAAHIHALAYTAGPHIVFSRGAFQPSTRSGRRVLVHELAHVVQAPGLSSGALTLGDPKADAEMSAEHIAASVADGSHQPVPLRGFPTAPAGVVRRIVSTHPQQPPRQPQSRAEERAFLRRIEIAHTMEKWKGSYTQKTKNAVDELIKAMRVREIYVESLDLDPDAEKRIEDVTDKFVNKLKGELSRNPKDDPNQEGSVLGIHRLWYPEFSNKLDLEQLKKAGAGEEEPGDYPRPANPLDLPKAHEATTGTA